MVQGWLSQSWEEQAAPCEARTTTLSGTGTCWQGWAGLPHLLGQTCWSAAVSSQIWLSWLNQAKTRQIVSGSKILRWSVMPVWTPPSSIQRPLVVLYLQPATNQCRIMEL